MTPFEPARAELRLAANGYANLIYGCADYDDPAFVDAITRLEVAAKAFADSELKKLLEVAKCPDVNCDNNGSTWHVIQGKNGDPEQEQLQCQWCDERKFALKTPPGNQPDGAS